MSQQNNQVQIITTIRIYQSNTHNHIVIVKTIENFRDK